MIQEIRVTLSRLNCSGCVRNVTNALQSLPGVEVIGTDIPAKTVHLRYAPDQATVGTIKTALAAASYPVVKAESVDLCPPI